jgi:uncharacterized membrane protein
MGVRDRQLLRRGFRGLRLNVVAARDLASQQECFKRKFAGRRINHYFRAWFMKVNVERRTELQPVK